MEPLTLEAALEVWEHGRGADTTRRALALLNAGGLAPPEGGLEDLPLGDRDRRLLELRAATFGPRMTAVAPCPRCAEEVEVRLPVERFLALPESCRDPAPVELSTGAVRFRPLTSGDLLEVQALGDTGQTQQALIRQCLLAGEQAPAEAAVSSEDLSRLAEAMSEADPLAEILLDLECGACSHPWQEVFEVADFLYEEVSLLAHRLLREVATLARGYGWREAEILAMSPERRRAYLELLEA